MRNTIIHKTVNQLQTDHLPLPTHSRRAKPPAAKNFSALRGLKTEKAISSKFTEIVNGKNGAGSLFPGFKVALSENRSDPGDKQRPKVDGALYVEGEAPTDGRPLWEKMRMLIDFKRGGQKNDPYDGNMGAASTDDLQKVLGQIADCTANTFEHGHRVAIYLLLINGTKARMTLWDRSGSIYTDAFDYVKQPEILRDLLWRFSLLDTRQQGLDPTVAAVSPEEHELMDALAAESPSDLSDEEGTEVPPRAPDDPPYVFAYVRKMFGDSLNPNWVRWKTCMESRDGRREFLAGMPQFIMSGLVCRGTRGYVAYDCNDKRFVWLKDTWRPDYPRVQPEGDVMEILAAAGVRNIPTLVCHGDTGHATQTPLYAKCTRANNLQKRQHADPLPNNAKSFASDSVAGIKRRRMEMAPPNLDDPFSEELKIRPLTHYRLVVEEVCHPLQDFTCGRDLVTVVRDALIVHEDAANKADLLHRDVSIGNILIYPRVVTREDGTCYVSRCGLLSDWELAKKIHVDSHANAGQSGPRRPERTGTWQFISVFSLNHPLEPMTIADDIESFFYILLYCGLRYMRHNCDNVPFFLTSFFDSYIPKGETLYCGGTKREAIRLGKIILEDEEELVFVNKDDSYHLLDCIISDILPWIHARYVRSARPSKVRPPRPGRSGASRKKASNTSQQESLTEEDAQKVSRHADVIEVLNDTLTEVWPTDDKVRDQAVGPLSSVAVPASNGGVEERPAKRRAINPVEPAAEADNTQQRKGRGLVRELLNRARRSGRRRGAALAKQVV
ncbi:hypothetical protein BD413DRAFT_31623 [Trametes elegans]|nr:hypothetical protein BD413DRAFT_31623 [Trametes elegans]